jgi:hypothetical protein
MPCRASEIADTAEKRGAMRLSWFSMSIFGSLMVFAEAAALASEALDLFHSESAARQHCSRDGVVWVDVPTNRYWRKGQPGYGGSKTGGYTCLKNAVHAHNRPAIAIGTK